MFILNIISRLLPASFLAVAMTGSPWLYEGGGKEAGDNFIFIRIRYIAYFPPPSLDKNNPSLRPRSGKQSIERRIHKT